MTGLSRTCVQVRRDDSMVSRLQTLIAKIVSGYIIIQRGVSQTRMVYTALYKTMSNTQNVG